MINTSQLRGDETAAGDVRSWLRRGILAARAGDRGEARRCFAAARGADPDNFVALLWLAWLVPTREESIALLIRVLELDPKNEHAHAGIRWARRRPAVSKDPAATPSSESSDSLDGPGGDGQPPGTEPPSDPSALRGTLRSPGIQEEARKGVVAQRARRLIGPFGLLLAVACLFTLVGIAWVTWYSAATVLASLPLLATETPTLLPTETPVPTPTFTVMPAFTPMPTATPPDAPTPVPSATPTETATPTATPTVAPSPLPTATPLPPPPPPSATSHSGTATPVPPAPPPGASGEKWIDVNLTQQQLTAYQGNTPVFQALVSTGLPGTPTVVGHFRIYWKLLASDMAGPGYYLPAVPYTMYFLRGYSLHGTYWHHNFGHPMSHGCVNLRTEDAKWLFDWTDPPLPSGVSQIKSSGGGTLVVIHY